MENKHESRKSINEDTRRNLDRVKCGLSLTIWAERPKLVIVFDGLI